MAGNLLAHEEIQSQVHTVKGKRCKTSAPEDYVHQKHNKQTRSMHCAPKGFSFSTFAVDTSSVVTGCVLNLRRVGPMGPPIMGNGKRSAVILALKRRTRSAKLSFEGSFSSSLSPSAPSTTTVRLGKTDKHKDYTTWSV